MKSIYIHKGITEGDWSAAVQNGPDDTTAGLVGYGGTRAKALEALEIEFDWLEWNTESRRKLRIIDV